MGTPRPEITDIIARYCAQLRTMGIRVDQAILFGSHARGDARPDSDVDLCIVADGAAEQIKAAQAFRRAMRPIRPKPAFTLVPIAAVSRTVLHSRRSAVISVP